METIFSTTETAHAMVSSLDHEDIGNQWILDSGATCTMCSNHNWFCHFMPLPTLVNVILADKHHIQGTGIGSIAVLAKANGKWHHAVLQNVLHVPKLHGNFLSVRQLINRGNSIWFTKKWCQLLDQHGTVFFENNLRGPLYPLSIRVLMPESAHIAMTQTDHFPSEGEAITPHTKLAKLKPN
jgi:hypothetical protein